VATNKRKLDAMDPKFWEDMMQVSAVRQVKFKEHKPSDKSFREMTRILRTAPSYPRLMEELKSLPKRRNK